MPKRKCTVNLQLPMNPFLGKRKCQSGESAEVNPKTSKVTITIANKVNQSNIGVQKPRGKKNPTLSGTVNRNITSSASAFKEKESTEHNEQNQKSSQSAEELVEIKSLRQLIPNLVIRDMYKAVKMCQQQNLNLNIRINTGYCRCSVFVFDLFVKEASCLGFPPVKLQVTEDYPGEIPVLLHLHLTGSLIKNEGLRLRFKLAVKIFCDKAIAIKDHEYNLSSLIYLWSSILKNVSILPESTINNVGKVGHCVFLSNIYKSSFVLSEL